MEVRECKPALADIDYPNIELKIASVRTSRSHCVVVHVCRVYIHAATGVFHRSHWLS
jgi:hypothetical protein